MGEENTEIKESSHASECVELPCGISPLQRAGEDKHCPCMASARDPALLPMNRASSGHILGMAENTAPKDEQNPLRRQGGNHQFPCLTLAPQETAPGVWPWLSSGRFLPTPAGSTEPGLGLAEPAQLPGSHSWHFSLSFPFTPCI